MPPGPGRPPFLGPGTTPVAPTLRPHVGMPYRPAGVPPVPVMRAQPPLPSVGSFQGLY